MEIDVSAWTVIRDEPGGRDKNKRWIAGDADAPRDQHRLWKCPAQTLEQLGLGAEAEPLEVLAVSGGGRTGDTYELTPLPQPGPVSLRSAPQSRT